MKQIKSGEIFLIDTSKNFSRYGDIDAYVTVERIVFFDKLWAFIDLRHDDIWEMDKRRKGLVYFAPRGRNWIEEESPVLGFSAVKPETHIWFRTDLLIRIAQHKYLSWDSHLFDDKSALVGYLGETQTKSWHEKIINATQIYLITYTKTGAFKPPVLVTAVNGEYFTTLDILWQASQLQRKIYRSPSKGVGIFRAGSKGAIAAFYIGDYFDRAGILQYFDAQGIDVS